MHPVAASIDLGHGAQPFAPRVRRARTRPDPKPSPTTFHSTDDDSVDEPVYDEDTDDDDDDAHEREWNAYLASTSAANSSQTLNHRSTEARTDRSSLQNSIEMIAATERLYVDRRAALKSRVQASTAPTQRFDALLFGHAARSFTVEEEDDGYHNELQPSVYDRDVHTYARSALRAVRANPTEHSAIRIAVVAAFDRARECARRAWSGCKGIQPRDTQTLSTSTSAVGQIGNVPPPPYRKTDALATDVQQLTEIYACGRPELAEWVHCCHQKAMDHEKGEFLPCYSETDPLATLPRYQS